MPRISSSLLTLLLLIFAERSLAGTVSFRESQAPRRSLFKENKGQVHDQFQHSRPDILFSGSDGPLSFFLKQGGISYQLNRIDRKKKKGAEAPGGSKMQHEPVAARIDFYRLDISWLNANTHADLLKQDATEGYENYYSESCPAGALKVKSYGQVLYRQLYPGIDLNWYCKNAALKYDFRVGAGADYRQIQFKISGAQEIHLGQKGELILQTPFGTVVEEAPVAEQNGKSLKARWLIKGEQVSFLITGFDPGQAFVIDPLVRLWGSYFGGSLSDEANNSACDAAGNVYQCGETQSLANIATSGAYQTVYGGGATSIADAYLVKFDTNGNRLWATYYGGTGSDYANFCFTDPNGDPYLIGGTSTTVSAVITTPGAYQTVPTGGGTPSGSWGITSNDAFLVKFDAAGARIWGTYFGGNGYDYAFGGGSDSSGNIYICGSTSSSISIATPGSHQPVYGGIRDAFLAQFSMQGSLQWATYYGSSGVDDGCFVDFDATGNVYVAGNTNSAIGIATPGAHQANYGGGPYDAFLAKFNVNGQRLWGTYYGGSGFDYGWSVKAGTTSVYLTGNTSTSNTLSIATPGAHQTTNAGSTFVDAYVVAFDPSGSRQWGTFYGGPGLENWTFMTIDLQGDLYLSGATASSSGIATPCTYQDTYGGGSQDAYLVKFTSGGQRLWGTYYSGIGNEEWVYCNTDAAGHVYISGKTTSQTNMASANGFQPQYGSGAADAFLVKFDGCIPSSPSSSTPSSNLLVCSGKTTILSSSLSCDTRWFDAPTGGAPLNSGNSFTTPTLAVNTTYYLDELSCGISAARTAVEVTVAALPVVSVVNSPPVICPGQSSTLSATGASSYAWSSALGNSPSLVISPSVSTTYTVTGSDGNCSGSSTTQVQVLATPNPIISTAHPYLCLGSSLVLGASGAESFSWQPSALLSTSSGSLVTASPSVNTTFTLIGTNTSGTVVCSKQNTLSVNVILYPQAGISSASTVCEGDILQLSASGGSQYSWAPPAGLLQTNGSVAIVSPTFSTVYTVTVFNSYGCGTATTVLLSVNPKPSVWAGRDTIFNLKEPMFISASGTGTITWIGGDDMICPDCPRTQIFPIRKTCYQAQAISDAGCKNTDEVCIEIGSEYAVYIPNTFTPNNDGLNDLFFVRGFDISNVTMAIYDRWGTRVFASTNWQDGWDGNYGGKPCEVGGYNWILEYISASGKHQNLSGHLNLLR